MKNFVIAAVVLLVLAVVLNFTPVKDVFGDNGCGTSDDISGVYTEIDPEEFPIEIVLLEDGTGSFTYRINAQIRHEEALSWEHQDNCVYEVNYFDDEGVVIAVEEFIVEDGILVFIVDGETIRYRKSNDADANADIVKGASGFMIWGDKGWDGAGVKYEIKGCKTTYEQYIDGRMQNRPSYTIKSTTDWNKVNWKGTGYKYNIDTEGYVFEAPGEAGVQVTHRYMDGEDVTQKLEMYYGYPGGALKKIMFPITVALDRFENAAHDLMKECPGKKSKY